MFCKISKVHIYCIKCRIANPRLDFKRLFMKGLGFFQLGGGERSGSTDMNKSVCLGTLIPEDLFS